MIGSMVAALVLAPVQPMAAAPAPATIVDQRPADEARGRQLSVSVFSCSFGIRALSDDGRARDRLAALQAAVNAPAARRLAGRRIVLRSYQLFLNAAASQMDMAMTVGLASVSGGASSAGRSATAPKCSQDKTPHGWFDPSETSNANPPLIVEIDATVDGRPLRVRSVHSPAKALRTPPTVFSSKARKNFAEGDGAVEVQRAFDKANARFVAEAMALVG